MAMLAGRMLLFEVNVSANKKSPHPVRKANIAVTAIAGLAIGTITDHKVLVEDAPSMLAASTISCGMESMYV